MSQVLVLILWKLSLILKDSPDSMMVPDLACPLGTKYPMAWKPQSQVLIINRSYCQLEPH